MRRDVRESAPKTIDRECETCETDGIHTLCNQFPAVSTSGAWGKYLNPVYHCLACQRSHVLALYESPVDRPAEMYRFPPTDPSNPENQPRVRPMTEADR